AAPTVQPPHAAAVHPRQGAAQTYRPQERTDASTASYTAQAHQAPVPAPHAVPGHRATRARRPGPPAKVAVPLLLLALACYAVGFWALARI
ncbi:serine/threonine protein kinase, partial [Streptomyces sp. DH24]|nr:serine/threonine protein kinase [Streptomyces sp. DH24]